MVVNGAALLFLLALSSLSGGADKNAVVFQKDTEQIIATLKGHTKKVTGTVYHPREVSMGGFPPPPPPVTRFWLVIFFFFLLPV